MTAVRSFIPLVKFLFILVVCATVDTAKGAAEPPDSWYVQIYNDAVEADGLNAEGKKEEALRKYRGAYGALLELKRAHPGWNSKVVNFRLNDLSGKITSLSQPTDRATGPVKLLSPGNEPRQTLRLQPEAGQSQSNVMTLGYTMTLAGQVVPMPPMRLTTQTTVRSVAESGDITYESVVLEVSVLKDTNANPDVLSAFETAMTSLKGMTTTGVISSRGIARKSETRSASSGNPQVQQTLDLAKNVLSNISVQLPEEAVGVGAKWEVREAVKSQGMTINQVTTYEVTAIEGSQVRLNSTLSQTANNQRISNPSMPSVRMDLTRMTGPGSGETTLDLAKLVPTAAVGHVRSEAEMTLNSGGQRQPLSFKMELEVRVE